MHLLPDVPSQPAELTAPAKPFVAEIPGLRQFCKSVSRVQEILCWAAVENLISLSPPSSKPVLGADVGSLCETVRELARNLAECSSSSEAIAAGYLDCQRMAAVVHVMGCLSQNQIGTALHTTYLRGISSPAAPFLSFGSFLLNICDAVEKGQRAIVFEPAAIA